MPSPSDNTSKWKQLSEIDYFGLFIKNWLAFNSWYRGHHPNLKSDRDCINELKNTTDARNSAFTHFCRLVEGSGRDSISFRDSIDGLVTSLTRVTLRNSNQKQYKGSITFENALVDKKYINLIVNKSKVEEFENRERGEEDESIPFFINLGSIYVVNDTELLYKATLELIYQIRCLLFHGELEPTEENHQIVKYAYLVMNSIMKNL
jgi:hypothetical protein